MIIAISGFYITIIVGLWVGLFRRLFGGGQSGVRKAVVVALPASGHIQSYPVLMRPRSGRWIWAVLRVFANLVGRRQDGLHKLAVVALLIGLLPTGVWLFLGLNSRKPDLILEE